MQVNVRGALRFKHRAGLEKGVVAFDERAYPEFFKSELWTLVGPFAFCERAFEIEPDCDYTEAFLAMASEAVEGSIELHENDRKEFVEVHKLGRPLNRWWKTPRTNIKVFGQTAQQLAATWAAQLEKAKADDAAKAKKSANKAAKDASKCTVVELPSNPSYVVVRPDGSLAVAAGNKLVFVAATGELLGTTECSVREHSQFKFGITKLHALPDGRVLAFQELDDEARLATLGEATAHIVAESTPGKARPIRSASSDATLTVLEGRHSFVVLAADGTIEREIEPWPGDYVRGVLAWRGRVVVWGSDKTAVYERDGTKLFEVPGADAIAIEGGLVTIGYRDLRVVDERGTVTATVETGSIGWIHHQGGDTIKAVAVRGTRIAVGTSLPDAVAEYDLTGAQRWRTLKSHTIGVAGVLAMPAWTAAWAEQPIVNSTTRAKDTTIAAYRDGTELARCDAKATVLGAITLGDDSLAAWVDGRTTGAKVLVWRDVSTAPKLETLTGHKGRVRGLVALPDGRFASWAADKTLRIWRT